MKKAALLALMFTVGHASAALPGAEAFAKLIMSQFDTNQDGKLDAGEWQTGVAKGFDEMDANSDGLITGDEIDALSSEIAKETGDIAANVVVALIKKIIMSLDEDGNKSVSRVEYTGKAEGIFKKLDADGNGIVTATELQELPTKALGL